jgi:DNA-binding SARP family transcriptional activator
MALAEKWLDEAWRASEGTFMARYRPAILQARAYCSMLAGNRGSAIGLLKDSIETGKAFNAWPYARGIVPMFDWMVGEALETGIEVPYIQDFIRKYSVPPPEEETPNWPWPVKVHTLGEFRIEIDGRPLSFSRKAPKKPLALLRAIIALGGRNVPEQKLVDALWKDEDGDAAREAFAVSLHRLRKLLVHAEGVQLMDGLVSLNSEQVWVDVWAFDRRVKDMDRRAERFGPPALQTIWSLYRGSFLAEDSDAPWALSLRERLRGQFLRCVSTAGRQLEELGDVDAALQLFRKGIEADDLVEEFYQGQMRCLLKLDRRAEAMSVFRRLRQTLSVSLGISPSQQSEQLFRSIQQQG